MNIVKMMAIAAICWNICGYSCEWDEGAMDTDKEEQKAPDDVRGLDADYGYAPGANGPAEPN